MSDESTPVYDETVNTLTGGVDEPAPERDDTAEDDAKDADEATDPGSQPA